MAAVPDPIKLLEPDPDYVAPILHGKFFPGFMATLGFSAVCISRLALRRPLFSGIPTHILTTALTGTFGIVMQRWYDNRNLEKDAVYRHYISLHPEDFPMPERKKIGEIFPKFTPVR